MNNIKPARIERDVEQYLVRQVERHGGKAPKWGVDGWPDRIVLLPDVDAFFVELKAPGKRPTNRQKARMNTLRAQGKRVYVIDRKCEKHKGNWREASSVDVVLQLEIMLT